MPSEFIRRRRVEFADTDAAGLIHFTALLRFMEETEHAFYRSLGFSGYWRTEASVTGFPRVSVSCEYLAPLRYGEEVTIRLLVREVRAKAIRFEAGFSVERGGGSITVARGEMTVVCATRRHGEVEWEGVEIPTELERQLEVAASSIPRPRREPSPRADPPGR